MRFLKWSSAGIFRKGFVVVAGFFLLLLLLLFFVVVVFSFFLPSGIQRVAEE